jgi:hypothetical protein
MEIFDAGQVSTIGYLAVCADCLSPTKNEMENSVVNSGEDQQI